MNLTPNPEFLPKWGWTGVMNPMIGLKEAGIEISCDSFESRDADKNEGVKYIKGAGIVILKDPGSAACPDHELMTFQTDYYPCVKGERFSGRFLYENTDREKFRMYRTKKAFGVFITVDGE